MLHLFLCILGLLLLLLLARGYYNVFLHPLSRYPGPLLYRASFLPLMLKHCQGDSTRYIEGLHMRYGPVVRVEPNLLSYADSQAWLDIYGHRKTGPEGPRGHLPKTSFGVRKNLNGVSDIVSHPAGLLLPPLISLEFLRASVNMGPFTTKLSASSEHDHRRMRRVMNHMFAPSALANEEPLVQRYVDKMVTRLREKAAQGEEVDMVMWYKYVLLAPTLFTMRRARPRFSDGIIQVTPPLICSVHWPSTRISAVLRAGSSM
jgi:hypothetical protein